MEEMQHQDIAKAVMAHPVFKQYFEDASVHHTKGQSVFTKENNGMGKELRVSHGPHYHQASFVTYDTNHPEKPGVYGYGTHKDLNTALERALDHHHSEATEC